MDIYEERHLDADLELRLGLVCRDIRVIVLLAIKVGGVSNRVVGPSQNIVRLVGHESEWFQDMILFHPVAL